MTKIKTAIGFPKQAWNDALVNNTEGAVGMIEGFLAKAQFEMRDRAICETDSSFLQLLPYIIVMTEDQNILTYRRPDTGDEPALHGMYSIGFGGHMDSRLNELDGNLNLIIENALRELLEELPFTKSGLPAVLQLIYGDSRTVSFSKSVSRYLRECLREPLFYNNMARIINKTGGVDDFHLALVLPIRIHKDIIDVKNTNNEAADISWKSIHELKDMKLESWSRTWVDGKDQDITIFRDVDTVTPV